MTRWIKGALGVVALLLLAGLAWYVPARAGWFASDRATLVERYASAPSQFLKIDGVDVHVRVEGRGPPVLMLHGTGVNLHEWDPLVARLKPYYTIVRMDWPPYGLSGLDPKNGYTTKRAAELVGGVLDRLAIPKIAVIATSNGSNVALQYASGHPERITAMAFSILPLERPSQTRAVDWKIRAMMAFNKAVLPDYHPKIFYKWVFEDTSHPGWAVPPYLPQMMYDQANLPGAVARQQSFLKSNAVLFKTTDVGAIAATIRAPVLLQWCERDTVIAQGAEASVRRFANTHVELVRYPDVGHWPMWEIPDRFAKDVKTFLDKAIPAR